jgi:putative Mg2+ transporter-C (MgtC) family protein
MTPEVHWQGIVLRLVLTVIAGGLLGMERSRSGHPAGLRTTLLVTLAASIAMIQMNLLIPTNGKPHDSYAVMDLMRLPLGILTGVGFIGAGAIVRKGNLVLGITTAATMWFATVVGLCLGGGQLVLGSSATVIGLIVLWGLRSAENKVERYQSAELRLTISDDSFSADDLRSRLQAAHFHVKSLSVTDFVSERRKRFGCEVRWPSENGTAEVPPVLQQLEQLPGLIELEWRSVGVGPN